MGGHVTVHTYAIMFYYVLSVQIYSFLRLYTAYLRLSMAWHHISTGVVHHLHVDLRLPFTYVDQDRLPAGSEESATDDSAHTWLELLG